MFYTTSVIKNEKNKFKDMCTYVCTPLHKVNCEYLVDYMFVLIENFLKNFKSYPFENYNLYFVCIRVVC